jgi:hypothetical protein
MIPIFLSEIVAIESYISNISLQWEIKINESTLESHGTPPCKDRSHHWGSMQSVILSRTWMMKVHLNIFASPI